MEVLVTGGSGFTGSNLVKKLLAKNHKVRVLARASSKVGDLKKLGANIIIGDISKRDDVFGAVKGTSRVFNIAASYRDASLDKKRENRFQFH